MQTLGLRCFWDLLTLTSPVSCVWLSPLPTAHNTRTHTHKKKQAQKPHTHAAWGFRAHTKPIRTHANLTHSDTIIPWPWMPKWVQGKRYVCVSEACVCWQTICFKLTPPPLAQWQQVSPQGPGLCELSTAHSGLGTKQFVMVTFAHIEQYYSVCSGKLFFPCSTSFIKCAIYKHTGSDVAPSTAANPCLRKSSVVIACVCLLGWPHRGNSRNM